MLCPVAVGQRVSLSYRARCEQERAETAGESHADRGDVRLDVLHRVIDGTTKRYAPRKLFSASSAGGLTDAPLPLRRMVQNALKGSGICPPAFIVTSPQDQGVVSMIRNGPIFCNFTLVMLDIALSINCALP